jgi:2-isopropylmalate synthase
MGIGERAGIVDLVQLATALTQFGYKKNFKLDLIQKLARSVSLASGYKPDETRPIIGKNVFTHTSAYHVRAVRSNPETYEPFNPQLVGRERKLKDIRPTITDSKLPFKPSIKKPFIKGASELKYHTDGPGTRWVHLDSRIDNKASFYVIQRLFEETNKNPEKHVDKHTHHCDSAFLFWGENSDGTGLTCCVQIDGEEHMIISPATVFIPAFIEHSYHYVSGKGSFTNIVLAPDYNQSLIESNQSLVLTN